MRTAFMAASLLLALSAASGLPAAEPPAVPGAPAANAPTPAKPPAAGAEQAAAPDRIEPTEKVRADSEISFPVDI